MTSQIFANIYLNEFDRFVRHFLKPQAYMRYGDDFVLFFDSKHSAMTAKNTATLRLKDKLNLQVNPKHNVIIRARKGLRFLGHVIYPNAIVATEPQMVKMIEHNINTQNVASYGSMLLPDKYQKQLPWLLIDE